MADHSFFQNKDCAYFPCHKTCDAREFNCLFCFCPLYALGDRCGGNFIYLDNGIKDCSACLKPHKRENYELIMQQLSQVIELAKKP